MGRTFFPIFCQWWNIFLEYSLPALGAETKTKIMTDRLGDKYQRRLYTITNTSNFKTQILTNMKLVFKALALQGILYAYEDTAQQVHMHTPATPIQSYNMFTKRLRKYGTLKVYVLNENYHFDKTEFVVSDHYID